MQDTQLTSLDPWPLVFSAMIEFTLNLSQYFVAWSQQHKHFWWEFFIFIFIFFTDLKSYELLCFAFFLFHFFHLGSLSQSPMACENSSVHVSAHSLRKCMLFASVLRVSQFLNYMNVSRLLITKTPQWHQLFKSVGVCPHSVCRQVKRFSR